MARYFESLGQYLEATSGIPTLPNDGSLGVWALPTWVDTNHYRLVFEIAKSVSPYIVFHIMRGSDNKIYAGWFNAGTETRVVLTSPFVSEEWILLWLVWSVSGNYTKLYKNAGTLLGSAGIDLWDTSGAAAFRVGNDLANTDDPFFRVADFCFYNSILTTTEMGEYYYHGIYPSSLTNRYKLIGNLSPEIDDVGSGPDLTVNGTCRQELDFAWNPTLAQRRPRGAFGVGSITKETGANARTGSGSCMKVDPYNTTEDMVYEFLVPVTASTGFSLSFWHKISSGFNGTVKLTIYDSDTGDATMLLNAETVTLTNDGAYHQYTSTGVTPSETGFCRCVIAVRDGSVTGNVFIDDFAVA
jgi:hypothetical protein